MRHDICHGHGTAHQAQYVRNAKGSQTWRGMVDLYVDDRETFDSEYHQRSVRVLICRAQEDVRGLHAVPQAGQPGKIDPDSCHVLQHRARGQVACKRRQAHTGPNRNTSSVTGASDHVPFLAEPPHLVLNLGDFMGCGGTWVVTGRFRCMSCLCHLGIEDGVFYY